jgi:probable HAF family extracellular repeat protein
MHDLGELDSMQTQAFAINVWDQVVGEASDGGKERAFIFSNGVMRDLNDLIPPGSGWLLTKAYGINDHGQIVGMGRLRDDLRAFLLDPRPAKDDGPSLPAIRVEPASLFFGEQPLGAGSAPHSVRFTNQGLEPLAIESVRLAGSAWEEFLIFSGAGPKLLAPGETRTIRISFKPDATGARAAVLEIRAGAAPEPYVVALSGLGVAPALQVGVSSLDTLDSVAFGDQVLGTSSSARTLALTNSGRAPLKIRRMTLAGDHRSDFRISLPGTITLAPNATRALSVRFAPMALGPRGATLQIDHNAASRPYRIALAGTGTFEPGAGSAAGEAPRPRRVELWTAVGSSAPARAEKIRVDAGQCVTLWLRARYPNGAIADVTEDPRARFVVSPAAGSFSASNVWCPEPADAGRSLMLAGELAPWQATRALTARIGVAVRAPRKVKR